MRFAPTVNWAEPPLPSEIPGSPTETPWEAWLRLVGGIARFWENFCLGCARLRLLTMLRGHTPRSPQPFPLSSFAAAPAFPPHVCAFAPGRSASFMPGSRSPQTEELGWKGSAGLVCPRWPGRHTRARVSACTGARVCLHVHTRMHGLTHMCMKAHACACGTLRAMWVCRCVLTPCACSSRYTVCLSAHVCLRGKGVQTSRTAHRARPTPAHWMEPLGEVTGHLGKAEQK